MGFQCPNLEDCQGVRVKPRNETGEAMTTHQSNRAEAHNNLALESSPFYQPIVKLAQEGFSRTAAKLLARPNA